MAIKFTTTMNATKFIKILVYGNSGVGKTFLSKTAPSPIIISSERRLLTLKDENIPVILVENHQDLDSAYDFITTHESAKKYKTVVLDSISDIAETILEYFKEFPKDGNTHPQAAYGAMIDEVLPLIKKFRDISDKHVYFIAKAKFSKDEYTGITSWMPSMPGRQLGPGLPYLFDFVLPLKIGENADGAKYRFLQTEEDIQWLAKECSGKLNAIEKADLTLLFNKVIGESYEKDEIQNDNIEKGEKETKTGKKKPSIKKKPEEVEKSADDVPLVNEEVDNPFTIAD